MLHLLIPPSYMEEETNIAFGVVRLSEVKDEIASEIYQESEESAREKVIKAHKKIMPERSEADIEREFEDEEFYPIGIPLERDGLLLGVTLVKGRPYLWVYDSPHVERTDLCTTDYMEAGKLCNLNENGHLTFILPKEWRKFTERSAQIFEEVRDTNNR